MSNKTVHKFSTDALLNINKIDVEFNNKFVGTIAQRKNGICAFQYDTAWIQNGFSLNPLELPLNDRLFISKRHPFDGMFGIFIDSLPDGWGKLLTDRKLHSLHINPVQLSNLARLALVGDNGKGALEYVPRLNECASARINDYDKIAQECLDIFDAYDSQQASLDNSYNFDVIFSAAGSSGGARPKINALIDGEEWIVKFASSLDPVNIADVEYAYMMCAQKCGINTPQFKLLPSKRCSGYFAVKRFDREGEAPHTKKIHTCSASGLLGVTHRLPSLDYLQLMQLTWVITHNKQQMLEMYRRMCFNVFAHNRDDHSNNFSFTFNEFDNEWSLSPVYDLTFSSSLNGEHATTVNGNGVNPGIDDILVVADEAGLNKTEAKNFANEIKQIVENELGEIIRQLSSS